MSDQNNPWASQPDQAPVSDNPWGASPASPGGETASPSADNWLDLTAPPPADSGFDWLHPFDHAAIPLDKWVEHGLSWVVDHFRPAFQAIRVPVDATLGGIEHGLLAVPPLVMLLIIGIVAWQVGGRRLALGSVVSMLFVGLIGAWDESMVTLALVLTSVFFCLLIGLPLGIAIACNNRLESIVRPLLDAMQTTPAFVYLVPVVMLFGIGNVPGVVVTIVFALPPLIRLTNLGIRQVREDLIEASKAFGASPWQMLMKVQLPLAMPTIMAGLNQTLMLALSMVVIASMIAVGGLGQMVLRGIGRLDMGLATVGGMGIVILAIMLDRITQSMAQGQKVGRWYERGPLGILFKKRDVSA